jgi:hypothetical protein
MVIALAIFAFASLILTGYSWVAAILAVLLVLLGVPLRYEVRESEFVIRSGLLRLRHPYRTIRSIELERRPDGGDGRANAIVLRLQNDRQARLVPRELEALRAALEEKVMAASRVPEQAKP